MDGINRSAAPISARPIGTLLGADLGWSRSLFAVMAAGLVLLALMWPLERWVEHRKGLPLVHLALLRDSSFPTGLLAVFFFTFANISEQRRDRID